MAYLLKKALAVDPTKTWLLVLCGCVLCTLACEAQQPTPSPMLLVYVQKPGEPTVIPRIALGLAQPVLKISGFEKFAAVTEFKGVNKLNGIAVKLKAEDAKALSNELNNKIFDDSHDQEAGTVWFATSDNKVLGYMPRNLVKAEMGSDGVLAFFADDDAPIFNYLATALKPR